MTVELWALFGVIVIFWVVILTQQIQADIVGGAKYALSNREHSHNFKGATPLTGRLTRLVRNHVEGIVLFAPLVLIAAAAGVSNVWTQYAAIVYFVSRSLHFFFYAAGLTPFRSIAWMVGFFLSIGGFVFGLVVG